MAATLEAGGKLDGAISVVRVLRTQQHEIVCAETDAKGRAAVAWQAYEDGSYLIGVARQAQSPNGPFRLTVEPAEPQPSPPGEALPAGGTQSTVNPILDRADAWAVQMARGTTYRINLTASGHCLTLEVYRPGTYSFLHVEPVRSSSCGGYVAFTPGLDGGGLYSLVVRAEGTASIAYPYHLQSAPYELDDGAPGIELASGQWAAGTLDGRGIDVVDLYHFTVPRPHQLTAIDLEEKANVGFDLVVLHEDGGRVACACDRKGRQVLRQTFVPGRYFVAVRSRHKSSGAYRLQVVTRDVTTTSISVNGAAFLRGTGRGVGAADRPRYVREPRRARPDRDRPARPAVRLAVRERPDRKRRRRRDVRRELDPSLGRLLARASEISRDAVQQLQRE